MSIKEVLLILGEGTVLGCLGFFLGWGTTQSLGPGLLMAGALAAVFALFRGLTALLVGGERRDQRRDAEAWRDRGAEAEAGLKAVGAVLGCPTVEAVGAVEALTKSVEQKQEQVQVAAENLHKVQRMVADLPKLPQLFAAHLTETSQATETATLSILERLNSLNTEVGKLLTTLDTTMFQAAEMYNSSQDKIKESRRMMEEMNTYQVRLDGEIQAAIGTLGRQVEGLTPFTSLIRDVTERTNVLAINAAIEASRAGKAGAGFAVVAGEVRQLSQQVASAADSIEVSVKQVSQTVNEKLSSIAQQIRSEDDDQGLTQLASALPRLSQDFHTTVEVLNRFAHETHDTVEGMRSGIMEVLGFAQFQDITRQQLDQVCKGLELVGRFLEEVAHTLDLDAGSPLGTLTVDQIAEDLRTSYTMVRQRQTHGVILEDKAEEEEFRPDIELF